MRMHHIGSAVFYPGLWDETQALTEAHADNLVVGVEGGPQIHIKPNGEVHLGGEAAADWVALAAKVGTELNAIRTDIDTLKAAFVAWVPNPPDGGAALKTAAATWSATPLGVAGSVAATKVKAD